VVSVVVCSPTIGALAPQQLRHGSRLGRALNRLQFFFENFAPPFPEKDVRDENTQERVKKLIIDFIWKTAINRALSYK
jgi:hypothetical protein